jgi:hypothetical protein
MFLEMSCTIAGKRILHTLIFVCCIQQLLAQENRDQRFNFKLGYANYYAGSDNYVNGQVDKVTFPNFRIESNYRFGDLVSTGVFFGYSQVEGRVIVPPGSRIDVNTPFFGIGVNLHLLQLLIESAELRPDFYIRGELGGHYYNTPDDYLPNGFKSDLAIGVGFAYYIWKQVGIYVEYTYGSYTDLRYGFTLKF